MTFDEIIIHEPRLITLLSDCYYASYIPNESFRSEIFDKLILPKVKKLVGWYCDDDALKETETYDIVYQTLMRVMGV